MIGAININSKGFTLVCLLFFFLSSCNDNKHNSPPKPQVSALKLQFSNVPVYKDYIGITQSIAAIGIKARVKGFLTQMEFIEGKAVKKNQLLFVIDPKPFEAKLNLAKGQLAKSIANRDYQQVQYQRLKKLVVKGDISQSNYDEVTARYGEALAQVEIDKANVEEAQINLGYCYMYSPIVGIVGNKFVDVGNLVGGTENTLLANVVQLDPIYIQFSPSVDDFSQLLTYRKNMPFKVEATFPYDKKLVFQGQVDLINNQAETSTSTILMRALIKNPQQLILPNIYMNVRIILSPSEKVLLVPTKAVVDTQGKRTVYVVSREGKIETRAISTEGEYQEQYIVKSGLEVNEVIVTSGLQKLQSGEMVDAKISS